MPTFPLRVKPPVFHGAEAGMRRFGAGRKKGRLHAGCDLYAPIGTPVLAIADGVVIDFRYFDLGTWQLIVHHPKVGVVRYTEVMPPTSWSRNRGTLLSHFRASGFSEADLDAVKVWKKGDTVKEGKPIAAVGKLNIKNFKHSMLHFEFYEERAKDEALTQRWRAPYQRHPGLLDPSNFLLGLLKGTSLRATAPVTQPVAKTPKVPRRTAVTSSRKKITRSTVRVGKKRR